MTEKQLKIIKAIYEGSNTRFLSVQELIAFLINANVVKIQTKKDLLEIFKEIGFERDVTCFIREFRRNRNKDFLLRRSKCKI